MRPTGQQPQRQRERLCRDLFHWLLCCTGLSTLALAAGWQILQPLLIETLSDSLTKRAHWYNFAVSHGGIAALRQLEPELAIRTSAPPVRMLPMRGDHRWRGDRDQRLLQGLEHQSAIAAISQQLNGTTALQRGFWLELMKPDPQGHRIWVLASDQASQTRGWQLMLMISLAAGVITGTLLHLHWQLVSPLQKLLRQMPSTTTHHMRLPDEEGGPLARAVTRQLNSALDRLNRNHEAQRLQLRGLAHDIRGPLGRLKLRCERLMSEGVVTRNGLQVHIEQINEDLDQLCELSGKISTYADSLADEQEAQSLELSGVLARVVAGYNNEDVSFACDWHMVRLPAGALKRCLNNLIDNALEHGRPPVLINATFSQGILVISVEDHGDGLGRSNQPILQWMPTANGRDERRHRGLGLGIVEQFCQTQGGSMKLSRSPELGGLRVELLLPQNAG